VATAAMQKKIASMRKVLTLFDVESPVCELLLRGSKKNQAASLPASAVIQTHLLKALRLKFLPDF
jgi:hypothetical protein